MPEAAQETYAPNSICFGCGPANEKGLQIKSHWETVDGEEVFVCDWKAEPHHQAFPGVLNGGILGALMDCHSNWCAATTLLRDRGLDAPPVTVTSSFDVKLRRPTPADAHLRILARPVEVDGDTVVVDARIEADGRVTASCRGTFVAVREGHPAYHRWG